MSTLVANESTFHWLTTCVRQCGEQGPAEADDAFAGGVRSARGIAGREDHQLRAEIHLHQLTGLEIAVFLRAAGGEQQI